MAAAPAIRQVYAELRAMLGAQIDATDVLHFAAQAIRFYLHAERKSREGYYLEEPEFSLERRAFESWPVDAAMGDGGWMVMEYELDLLRPEMAFGRAFLYEAPSERVSSVYASEIDFGVAEGDRLYRSLDWLSASHAAEKLAAYDDDDHWR